ncbi:lytic transglycosylase domain-containing protein [Brevundimonas sp. NPDC090276]|uniref:lytic transglycosylase domain-containing protein n=1 Tax=Brevundimonas sp. NPDC090276 TaxID=3363956 RepID=UPI00383A2CFD
MVRRAIDAVMLAGMLTAGGPVSAQVVDWDRAGGDLFGRVEALEVAKQAEGPARPAAMDQPFQVEVEAAAALHGVDARLLHALVIAESGYRPEARSHAGAGGLTQLMPATALELGVKDRFEPVENLRGGADYLARQLVRFQDVRLALAAYNAGPARVARLGRVPPIPETEAYVSAVIDCYLALTAGRRVTSVRECRSAGGAK